MKIVSKIKSFILLLPLIGGLALTQSCTESIDEGARYTFTGNTVISYLEKHDSVYSEYLALLDSVYISDFSKSTVSQLLSARGNYTCFAPTNEAIYNYLAELAENGEIETPSWDAKEFSEVNPETGKRDFLEQVRKTIVHNSLIDAGDDMMPYQTSDFSERVERQEMLGLANMLNNKLQITPGTNTRYAINGCDISDKNCNIYTINGYIHQVAKVIAPSTQTAAGYFEQVIEDKKYGFFTISTLLQACGLMEELQKAEDEEYYNALMKGELKDLPLHPTFGGSGDSGKSPGRLPERRYYGYTIFAEDDAWWETALMLQDSTIHTLTPKEVVEKVAEYVVANNLYMSGATTGDNYTDENNALNQFVTYHVLPARLEPNKLVIHFNELWYNLTTKQKTASVYDFHTTMGKRRLLKTYEANKTFDGKRNVIYLNRFPILKNGTSDADDYTEKGCELGKEGVEIYNDSTMQKPYNAYIYRISDCLYYNDEMAETFGKERIRIDAATMFKELMTNDIRCNENFSAKYQCVGMPCDNDYRYLEDCDIAEGTNFYYLTGRISNTSSWANYQGDELNVVGNYEMTMKLPPVPKDGTYELRLGISANDRRGMCQVYWGTNKNALPAAGIPFDMRMGGEEWYVKGGASMQSIVGWEADTKGDDDVNAEIDKKMRNNWYMKAPHYFYWYGQSTSLRARSATMRRIVLREHMEANKTYYIQFKSVLEDAETEFYMDYIEFCPKEVYDNPQTPEDIW